ncbi:nitrogenase-stabilizing/protective protein NifW [Neisseria shayeganii 871]|uniref:Nitrogenase-stabilizing/protective protein NifW n=1 Tax=Neisseria shayeganii 871 TaxID=1032488 RepID=G4CJS2_9NEIS|nr:nitrogenase-stabilizing/protective protein NifW [Neisseria shayeganii 871]
MRFPLVCVLAWLPYGLGFQTAFQVALLRPSEKGFFKVFKMLRRIGFKRL